MSAMTARPLWHEAAAFAAREHGAQRRRDGRTPYAVHPARVALIVATVYGVTDETTLAAAYLHDLIEDCPTDYEDLSERFGADVADIVAALTKDMRVPEAEREVRYDEQLRDGPSAARLIKLADVYDNLVDAEDAPARRKCLDRVERALAIADADPALADACDRLRRLVLETASNP
jgi:guanosine-3',5'-bis(diphosphate) 3'-pyrophosphohydrolase